MLIDGYFRARQLEIINIDLLTSQQRLTVKNEELKISSQQLEMAIPKIEFYDAVRKSETNIKIRDLEKILELDKNSLYETLRQKGILNEDNVAEQEYIDKELY